MTRRWALPETALGWALLLGCGGLHAARTMVASAPEAEVLGRVTTPEGVAIAGAAVALHCPTAPQREAHAVSDKEGRYRLPAPEPCRYELTVQATGFATFGPEPIEVQAATATLRREVTLVRADGAAASASRPSFQAAGIHGLIDPGGYSASVTADAAGRVLQDVSGAQRAGAGSDAVGGCTELVRRLKEAQQYPERWQAQAAAGRALLRRGEARRAVPFFERAVSLAPKPATEPRLNLADALVSAGRFGEALTELQAVSPETAAEPFFAIRARAEEGLGHFDGAVRDRAEALQRAATDDNLFALAYDHLLAGQVEEANRLLEEGLARSPASVPLLVGKGAVLFFQHRYDAAVAALLKAAQVNRGDRRPYPLLADVSRVPEADTAGVQEAMERHLAVDPEDPGGQAALGSFLLRQALKTQLPQAKTGSEEPSLSRAESLLRRAVMLQPGLLEARSELARLYHHEKRYPLEAEQLAQVAAATPSREVEYRLGLAYRASGEAQRAQEAMAAARGFTDSTTEGEATAQSEAHLRSLLHGTPAAYEPRPCPGGAQPDARQPGAVP